MPKIVDHDRRREELSALVWEVISEQGVDNATLRRIASSAGWSTGILTRYFANKDDLLLFSFELSNRRVSERVARLVDSENVTLETLNAAMLELLPLDAGRTTESTVFLSFLGRALSRSDMAEAFAQHYAGWRSATKELLGRLQRTGHLPRGLAVDEEADRMMAFIDGLSIQAILDAEHCDRPRLEGLVKSYVEDLSAGNLTAKR